MPWSGRRARLLNAQAANRLVHAARCRHPELLLLPLGGRVPLSTSDLPPPHWQAGHHLLQVRLPQSPRVGGMAARVAPTDMPFIRHPSSHRAALPFAAHRPLLLIALLCHPLLLHTSLQASRGHGDRGRAAVWLMKLRPSWLPRAPLCSVKMIGRDDRENQRPRPTALGGPPRRPHTRKPVHSRHLRLISLAAHGKNIALPLVGAD
mmetsp:Transcript_12878/g.25961  ORF Transcript_12878/g.25961 Transcript_12878/m.25961 type:complete len:206 (-) Transcript_12878:50-667(-)